MHDQLKSRNYATWAIVIGVLLTVISIMGWSRGTTGAGGKPPNSPGIGQPDSSGKRTLTVSRQAVKVMVDAALAENPALRENMPDLEKEYEKGAISQEMMVAQAIEQGIAAKDPIVRNRLSELFIMGIYQEADIAVTDDTVKKYYGTHKENYTLPDRRLLQHLFVRVTNVTDDEKARATLERLFKETRKPVSRQSESLRKAIAPVWITREEMRTRFGPTFADQVFSMHAGDWSNPIQSTSGWHRVKILAEENERVRNLDEVQAEVENDLRTKLRLEAYHRELDRLKKKYNVVFGP